MNGKKNDGHPRRPSPVTLKAVAERVGLTPGTVSAVLNDSPAARSVPERTKSRIFAAAHELNYRPNFLARALRVNRTNTLGVIAAEIGDPYGSTIISGIESYLRKHDFFYLTVAHRHDKKLLESYSQLLLQRGVEGFITIDTSIAQSLELPTVAVAGHQAVEGVTNIVIDHTKAAHLALQHLFDLGHRNIAFMKGPRVSSDTEDRWTSINAVARDLGIAVQPGLTVELDGEDVARAPENAIQWAKELLGRKQPFSAVFAYNDNTAVAMMRVIQESGLRVPDDISVVGFDDIHAAAYTNPPLTTVRQPLRKMGEIAARTLLDRIEGREEYVPEIAIEPQFVVRESSGNGPFPSPVPRDAALAS
ncbi:MAG: LacI family DNA-binding transcriptional regulator [Candidatus Acidiferrales bacterium]